MKTSSVLLALVIVFTFPIWIGLLGGLFGLVFGLLGGIFGLIGGILGGVFGLIGSIFGWGDYGWHGDWGHHHYHMNGFWIVVAIIAIAFALKSRARSSR